MPPYTEFSPHYQEQCFEAWYAGGRPSSPTKTHDLIPFDDEHKKPSVRLITAWMDELMWNLRADELDAKAIQKSETHLILKKAEMLKRQADTGFKMQDKGLKHLMERGFDSAASAVNAIVKGVDIERSSSGISEFLIKLSTMSDADVKEEILKLSQRVEPDKSIIDMGIPDEQKTDSKSDDE